MYQNTPYDIIYNMLNRTHIKEIDKVLNEDEKILWEGTPRFWPFIFSSSIAAVIFGSIWTLFTLPFLALGVYNIFFVSTVTGLSILFIPHIWIGPGVLLIIPLYSYFVLKYTYYCITDKRVIIQKGIIGRDFDIVDYDQITNTQVNIGIADKIFKPSDTGSILISTAGSFTFSKGRPVQRPFRLRNITNPYEVFKFFKKVSFDIKSDIQYPNQLRPEQNPGYQSEYAQVSQPVVNGQQV